MPCFGGGGGGRLEPWLSLPGAAFLSGRGRVSVCTQEWAQQEAGGWI